MTTEYCFQLALADPDGDGNHAQENVQAIEGFAGDQQGFGDAGSAHMLAIEPGFDHGDMFEWRQKTSL